MKSFLRHSWIIPLILLLTFFSFYCSTNKTSEQVGSVYLNLNDTVDYVGMQQCSSCHPDIHNTFIHTGMGMSFDSASRQKSAASFGDDDLVYDSLSNFYYKPFWENDSLMVKEFRLSGSDTVHQRIERIHYIVGSGQHTNSHITSLRGYLYQ
ncbi:MAG: hypothetical protein IH946_07985, partial [Bacteroidetes bacterium]|nr:hypothetical protein [Bacteroidota bacterium]